jgi:tryptophanyl-tRNA synthetase
MKFKRIVSGVQPSGVLHLGNYLGAIKGWTNYINKYQSYSSELNEKDKHQINSKLIFFIADNHSITAKFLKDENNYASSVSENNNLTSTKNSAPNTPIKLSDLVSTTAACLLASGVDPKKCVFFRQSDVKQHAELMWILSCITPQSWLNTMIQFKEKSKNNQLITSLGLYTYPILMAADILLYNAEVVPVGEDQIQHMDLTKKIAQRLNKLCGENIINIPEYDLNKKGGRIMSLQNAQKKMSKSDETKNSCISLLEKENDLKNLILKAKTDNISEIYYDNKNRPEVSNLINIYSCVGGLSYDEIKEKFSGKSFFDFKISLVEILSKEIIPISEKAEKILNNKNGYIDEILYEGGLQASEMAENNLRNIKKLLNFHNIKA